MSIPSYVVATGSSVLVSSRSDKIKDRGTYVALPILGGALGFVLLSLIDNNVAQLILAFWTTITTISHTGPAVSCCFRLLHYLF